MPRSAWAHSRSARSASSTATSAPARSTRSGRRSSTTTSTVDRDQRARRRLARVLGADHHHLDQVPGARDARRQPRRGRHPRPHRARDAARRHARPTRPAALVLLGVFGTALLYGDGMITPAISVLSAVEGLEVASTGVRRLGHPDRRRHPRRAVPRPDAAAPGAVGKVFGPIMVVWFAVLGVLGLRQIVQRPRACSRRSTRSTSSTSSSAEPRKAFLVARQRSSSWSPAARRSTPTWATSAAGRSARAGTASCCPALLLNYFGQGALLLREPGGDREPVLPAWPRSGRSRRS